MLGGSWIADRHGEPVPSR